MVQLILVGIGAGFAAALLFGSPIGGTFLAMPLFILTGLPIAIAGLGWTPLAAVIGVVAGGATVFYFLSPLSAGVFLLLFGLPMAWLTRLAGLWREDGESREWFPIGRLLLHAAGAVAIGMAAIGYLIGFDPDALARGMIDGLAEWFASRPDLEPLPDREMIEPFVRLNVAVLPYSLAAIALIIVVFDLWLAGIVTRTSGRLTRPQERLWTVSLPVSAAFAFVAAVGASFLPFPLGDIAALVAGALGSAFMLVGLAVLHAMTGGMSARTLLLVAIYVVLILLGFPAVIFVALGLGETLLHLRERRFGGAPPST